MALGNNNLAAVAQGSAAAALEVNSARERKRTAIWGIGLLRKMTVCPVDEDALEMCKGINDLANLLAEIVGDATHRIQQAEDRALHARNYHAALLGASKQKPVELTEGNQNATKY